MSEEVTQDVNPVEGQEPAAETVQTFDREYVQKLRNEAAEYRVKLKEIEEAQAAEKTRRLEEEARWKELAEQRAAELESLSPIKSQYEAMLETLRASNAKRIESIPEAMRSLVPEYEDPTKVAAWLDANAGVLTTPSMPSLDAGAGGDKPRVASEPKLTDAEIEMARKMGISPEDYAKYKIGG